MENQNYSIPMLEKGFELIEFISNNAGGVTMKALVDHLPISKTTIYRLLISLTDMGYIYKNEETAAYFLSKKMLKVGLAATGETNLVEQALPLMRHLRDHIKESVMLGVFMNNKAVLLEQVNGSHAFIFLLRPGTCFGMHVSVPGKVFAAYATSKEQEGMIDSIDFVRYNENTITSKEDFKDELKKVKELGYALDLEEEVKGVNCLGVPIYNQFGSVAAALWTSGPSGRLTEEEMMRIKDSVIDIGNKISMTLGYKNSGIQNI